jgi:hypothetical protein
MNYSNHEKEKLIELGFMMLFLATLWVVPVIIK